MTNVTEQPCNAEEKIDFQPGGGRSQGTTEL